MRYMAQLVSCLPYPNHVHTIDVVLPFFSTMSSVSSYVVMSPSHSALFSLSSTSVSLIFLSFLQLFSLSLSLLLFTVATVLAEKWACPAGRYGSRQILMRLVFHVISNNTSQAYYRNRSEYYRDPVSRSNYRPALVDGAAEARPPLWTESC